MTKEGAVAVDDRFTKRKRAYRAPLATFVAGHSDAHCVMTYDECYRSDVAGAGDIVLGTKKRWGRWWATGYAWNPTAP